MKKILIILWAYFTIGFSQGQGYIGPSPNATATMRQVNVGVSHYTGAANLSIPLAEISSRELGAGAFLSYNGFGHRVQDVASSTGLGWSLSAGGVITRVVRSKVDELGFCHPTNPNSDKEPDLFIYSFMGRSGKFVLASDGTPVLFPYQDLKIIPGMCGNGYIWEIIDETGTRYQFGVNSDALEQTTKTGGGSNPETFISSWYLSKIITPNGTDNMQFSYVSSTISYSNYFSVEVRGSCSGGTNLQNLQSTLTVQSKYISAIYAHGSTMEFIWNNTREDLIAGKSLAEIRVKDVHNVYVKKLRFEYGYFQAAGCTTALCKRLRLERIYDLSPEPLYSFTYNTNQNLPSRDSKSIDYLGLYNNYNGSDWIPAQTVSGVNYTGASRTPDINRMKANLLTRIDERGGAKTSFEYEPHSGFFGTESFPTLSGNRIKSITKFDDLAYGQTVNYWYRNNGSSQSSGLLFKKPVSGISYLYSGTMVILKRFSHSYNDIFDVNGVFVGYSRVEEELVGKGKTVYTFTNYDQYPDLNPVGNAVNGSPPFVSTTTRFWERGNLRSMTVFDLTNKIISRDTYDYNFNHPIKMEVTGEVKDITYNYCENRNEETIGTYKVTSRPFTLKNKITEVFDQNDTTRKITSIEEYEYDPVLYQLVTSRTWNTANVAEKFAKKYKYLTHSDYNLVNSSYTSCVNSYNQCMQNCSNPSGSCGDTCYSTFLNCLSQGIADNRVVAIMAMRNRHANNTLIEEQSWLERTGYTPVLLGASLSTFKMAGTDNKFFVPASGWASRKPTGTYISSSISGNQFVVPTTFYTLKTFDSYQNTNGRLTQDTGRDGIVTQYTWVYSSILLGTKTVNPGTAIPFTTSYFYKPLVGMIRETDPNNKSVNFEHDHNGRVRLVKNNDGRIKQRYRYHYKNETAAVKIKASKLQAMTGESIVFSLDDLVLPTGGTPGFAWDMANGITYDDNRQTVTHSYSIAGLYTVKAVLFTNEFAPYTATLDMLISSPLSVSMCVDGPQFIDLCYQNQTTFGSCTVQNNQPTSPTVFKANFSTPFSTGCVGIHTYVWEYKRPNESNWIVINSQTASATFPPHFQEGIYNVRCKVTDSCNNSVTVSSYVNLYKSNQFC